MARTLHQAQGAGNRRFRAQTGNENREKPASPQKSLRVVGNYIRHKQAPPQEKHAALTKTRISE
jgi:hypothetical protein